MFLDTYVSVLECESLSESEVKNGFTHRVTVLVRNKKRLPSGKIFETEDLARFKSKLSLDAGLHLVSLKVDKWDGGIYGQVWAKLKPVK